MLDELRDVQLRDVVRQEMRDGSPPVEVRQVPAN